MFSVKGKITVREIDTFLNDIVALQKKVVMVGVPESRGGRKASEMSNATLAYIHDNGSPKQGIPARPFMKPGIERAFPEIYGELKAAAKAASNGEKSLVNTRLSRAGMIAANSIKAVINEGTDFEPLKRSTLLGRLRKRRAATKWTKEKREAVMASMHPLVDTGAMRNSISYVVRDR